MPDRFGLEIGLLKRHLTLLGKRLCATRAGDEFLEQDSQCPNDLPDFGQWQGKTSDRRCLLVGDSLEGLIPGPPRVPDRYLELPDDSACGRSLIHA